MTLKIELMGHGEPAALANGLGFDTPSTALSGAGTTYADATALTSNFNIFTTVNSSTGAVLPPARNQGPLVVYNAGSNALKVYGNGGAENINGIVGSTGFSVTNGKAAVFYAAGNQWIANLGA